MIYNVFLIIPLALFPWSVEILSILACVRLEWKVFWKSSEQLTIKKILTELINSSLNWRRVKELKNSHSCSIQKKDLLADINVHVHGCTVISLSVKCKYWKRSCQNKINNQPTNQTNFILSKTILSLLLYREKKCCETHQ